MTKPKLPETPNEGGSYVRDPKTGKLKPAVKAPVKPADEGDKA